MVFTLLLVPAHALSPAKGFHLEVRLRVRDEQSSCLELWSSRATLMHADEGRRIFRGTWEHDTGDCPIEVVGLKEGPAFHTLQLGDTRWSVKSWAAYPSGFDAVQTNHPAARPPILMAPAATAVVLDPLLMHPLTWTIRERTTTGTWVECHIDVTYW